MSINERKDHSGRIKEVDLGLSESEQNALNEVRKQIAGDAVLDDLRDATWARYLRHNSWRVEPAIKQMKEYLNWRKENKIDRVLDNGGDFPSKDRIRTVIPYSYHGFDKEGRPIYIEKTGRIATAALSDAAICPPADLNMSHIVGVEKLQRKMYEQSLKTGVRVNGICTILDMEGLGFGHRQCLHVLKDALDFDAKYYPEYLGRLYVINAPWVTPYLYQAVSVFVDEITKQRVQIVAGDPSAFLLDRIAPENLPKEYGGNCVGEACNHGECTTAGCKGCCDVLDSSDLKAVEIPGLDQQDIAYDFEKTVSNGDKGEGALFTWYFEVADGYDIDFSVEMLRADGKRESDVAKKHYVQKVQRLKTGRGSFRAPWPNCQLVFRWDNNFSWMATKSIKYSLECMKDDSLSMDSFVDAKKSGASSSSSAASSSQ